MSFPEIGKKAPDFTLLNQNSDPVRLSDYAGHKQVVVYFYPKAMTPGCTTQACGIRDSFDKFQALNAVTLGISPDPVSRLGKFVEKQNLNFDLLSDEDHAIADRYGVWGLKKFMGREYMGIRRTTFVIDRDGRLRQILDTVKTKTHHDDIIRLLDPQA
jgi:peroxiredoxin Q/BCP